jgi:hypothetical protein
LGGKALSSIGNDPDDRQLSAGYRKGTAMKQIVLALTCVFMLAGISSTMRAQVPTFSPSKGQTAEQQTKDTGECRAMAVQQSGFDPAKAPAASQPQQSTGGEGVKGAAKGAAVGATAGAIGGDAGQGASTGAKAGMVAGGVNRRQNRREDKNQKEAQTAASQGQGAYNKAMTSCMQERGYVLK